MQRVVADRGRRLHQARLDRGAQWLTARGRDEVDDGGGAAGEGGAGAGGEVVAGDGAGDGQGEVDVGIDAAGDQPAAAAVDQLGAMASRDGGRVRAGRQHLGDALALDAQRALALAVAVHELRAGDHRALHVTVPPGRRSRR